MSRSVIDKGQSQQMVLFFKGYVDTELINKQPQEETKMKLNTRLWEVKLRLCAYVAFSSAYTEREGRVANTPAG